MEKIARVALATKFGSNVDEIMEVVNMTPNGEHAIELLLGIYEEPKFKESGTYTYKYKGPEFKDLTATFKEYNPWTKTLTINVLKPVSREIGIFKEFDEIVNKDNYTEYELTSDVLNKTDRDLWRWKTITLAEMDYVTEFIEDSKSIIEWYEMNMEC